MKKLLCVLLALLLTGCSTSTVDLMPGAKPETSALTLYVYDGETVTHQILFETEAVRAAVMEDFHNAKAKPLDIDPTTLQPPFYGLDMGGQELGAIHGLWSDGCFIMGNGKTYAFDYDFEALLAEYPWELKKEMQSTSVMPCAHYVAKSAHGWNSAFLTEAKEITPPEGITMELIDHQKDELTVRFSNNTAAEWTYGCAFSLQVQLDGQWYYIPAETDLVFTEMGYLVSPNSTREDSFAYDFSYGDLPSGHYRLVTNDLTAEFDVE